MRGSTERRKKRQSGQEILEFALMAIFLVPMLLGTFVVGTSIIKNLQANQVVRDLDNIYIHGGDFSTYPMQQLAQRLGQGLNLQFPAFGNGVNNTQSNTATNGDGLIWVSQVMYIGTTTDPNCVTVGAANCTNHDSFVFTQRIVFGNSSLNSTNPSALGDPTGATLTNAGIVQNYVTDSTARLGGTGQTTMSSLWQTNLNGQTPLTDGQVVYVVEGYFQTPYLSLGSFTSKGAYARSFF
jgi:hypothetical protein